jgi:hypothetical protein
MFRPGSILLPCDDREQSDYRNETNPLGARHLRPLFCRYCKTGCERDRERGVIQGHDGTLHAIYSCFIASDERATKAGEKRKSKPSVAKGIKHAAFDEAWIRLGD